ncbi:MAG: class I tRNA ligase family protein, partial [Acidimicrobiales bacterium]
MQLHISYPDKVTIDGLEERWIAEWERQGVYRFDDSVPADAIFSIDTPPPTVSGSLHIGHVFSYTHTDVIARYKRMRGFEVFYPMGFDDNGVPTERRVQNYYGVRCEPTLPYDPSLAAPEQPFDPPKLISRRNFIELCELLTKEDEKVFEKLWRQLGLSVDWSTTYTTVGALARKTSQRAFLDLLDKGKIYASDAPTLWDIDYQTAVAQAELEDRSTKGTYFRVYFPHESGIKIEIETSRPELIAACIAIVAHPDDERYQHLFGTYAYSPLFEVPLAIHPHPLASPDKGTGIAMVSSFGDLTDVTWWRELGLPTRVIMTRAGRLSSEVSFRSETFPSRNAEAADAYYQQIANKTSQQARKIMGDMLVEAGLLASEPKEIEHVVKYYEKGDRPLEIVASRQWYVRTLEESERLIELGRTVTWHPSYMRLRYENWVEGLNSDWNISRQRFFGIPMPVWYHTDAEGAPLYDQPILPDHARLPIDPQSDT